MEVISDDLNDSERDDSQFTSICFTWNNWDESVWSYLVGLLPDTFSYLIIGKEVAPSTGTKHLQCYAELRKRLRFQQIKQLLRSNHFERRRGTQARAIGYINNDPKKPNPDWAEFGKRKLQGTRSDLHRIAELALSSGMREVAAVASNLQQIRHGEAVLTYLEPVRRWKPKVTWICGASGKGKSKLALEMCEELAESDWFRKSGSNGKWFSGYDGHSVLWLDDVKPTFFGGEKDTYVYLLDILDRYPCVLETKGGQRQLLAKHIIITSLNHPDIVFDDGSGELRRRIDKIIAL